MEYLMTYGWAILIIAVVLGVMFQLGLFSASNLAPKASAGACQVVRPSPGVAGTVSLEGECNGQEPEYVAYFAGNGAGSTYSSNTYVTATVPSMAGSNVIYTVTMWIYVPTNAQSNMPFFGFNNYQAFEFFRGGIGNIASQLFLHRCTSADIGESSIPIMAMNAWHFAAVAVNPPDYYFQLDGAVGTATNPNTYSSGTTVVIGTQTAQCDGSVFSGYISDVQLYNTSLSASEIQALYMEGIGGAPIRPQNIVGWWPLNGNAQDYSGNNNNGQASGITYISSWTSGYTAP
jgi:hypothetical protein